MCLGTFSRRARSLATYSFFARVRIPRSVFVSQDEASYDTKKPCMISHTESLRSLYSISPNPTVAFYVHLSTPYEHTPWWHYSHPLRIVVLYPIRLIKYPTNAPPGVPIILPRRAIRIPIGTSALLYAPASTGAVAVPPIFARDATAQVKISSQIGRAHV